MRQTLKDLALCRTAALGGHVTQCDHCGEVRYHYHSCGNRHCPECGGTKRAAWLARCQAELLPVPYFHVVFTLPHELSALALGHRELMYRLLFDSAKETLLEVATDPKHLGARIGVLMVLHTWGQQLDHHPHVHCIVPGGGLAIPSQTSGNTAAAAGDPEPRWVSCRPNWFLPVRVLGRVFRGKYLAGLRAAYQAGGLQFAGSTVPLADPAAWATLIRALYRKEWVVYAKEPFGGPEHVLKYLTGYTHRVALSNRRLVKLDEDRVTFTWKDYADGCRRKEMTLEAVEFVRRFALHIIPKGMVRIRHYGLLAHRDRGERLALCRSLLGVGAAAEAATAALPGGERSPTSPTTASGAGPEPSRVEPRAASPSGIGVCVLAVWAALVVGPEGVTSPAATPGGPVAAVAVADGCPACGAGQVRTIWQADRPGRRERHRLSIWDSS